MKLVNPRTGKDFTGLAIAKKQKFPEPIKFVSMFCHGFHHLARLKFTPTEISVLFELLSKLDFENWIRISQQTVAEDLNLDKSNVSRAFRKLIKAGIIEQNEDPWDRRRVTYRLNPSLGWRGEPKEWVEYAAEKDLEPTPPCFVRKK